MLNVIETNVKKLLTNAEESLKLNTEAVMVLQQQLQKAVVLKQLDPTKAQAAMLIQFEIKKQQGSIEALLKVLDLFKRN